MGLTITEKILAAHAGKAAVEPGEFIIARLSVDEISRAVWPFVLAMLLALAIVTQWPALSTMLPALFGLK